MIWRFQACPIVLPVLLEGPTGETEARLVLDTGAVISVINRRPLEMIGALPTTASRSIVLTTAQGNVTVPVIGLVRMSFLDIQVEAPQIAIHNLPSNAPVDGLLGTDVMTGLGLRIDFASGEVEFTRPIRS